MWKWPAAPGRFISLAGATLHVQVSGAGVPVILEAGAGEWSSHWYPLLNTASPGIQWIAYDRAGLGWSYASNGRRDVTVLADELLALLDAMAVREPIVLVAHSFGASIARVFAATYPSRVRAVLFVDGWHDSFSEWDQQQAHAVMSLTNRLMRSVIDGAMQAGLLRLLNTLLPTPPAQWSLPDSVWRAMLGISTSGRCFRAARREADAYEAGDGVLMSLPVFSQPCIALVARETIRAENVPNGYPVAAHNFAWQQASARLAQCSRHGEWQLLDDTDHMVQLNRPEQVMQAIMALLARTS